MGTNKRQRPSAIAAARRLGQTIADDATVEIITLLEEHSDTFTEIVDRRVREDGGEPVDEECLSRFAQRLPPDQADALTEAITAYSDARSVRESALKEVAFSMGVALGIALSGKDTEETREPRRAGAKAA